jgi:hypothetical protein
MGNAQEESSSTSLTYILALDRLCTTDVNLWRLLQYPLE